MNEKYIEPLLLFLLGMLFSVVIWVISTELASAGILTTDTDGNQVWVTETGTGFNIVDMGGRGITQVTRTGNGYITIPPKGPASITQFTGDERPNYVTDQNMIWQQLDNWENENRRQELEDELDELQ